MEIIQTLIAIPVAIIKVCAANPILLGFVLLGWIRRHV